MSSKQSSYLMGLDLGTSAIKGVVMDEFGDIVCSAEKSIQYDHPCENWVQVDADIYLNLVLDVINRLSASTPNTIRALAFAAASGNTLLCNADGCPLIPIINWMDQRAVLDCPEVLQGMDPEAVREITGWPCVDTFPLGHLAWLREHEPELFNRADRYCMNTDWLLFQLTGKWVMDCSTATTFHLQDQVSGHYHQAFLDLLGIPENKLSKLVGSGEVAATVTSDMAERTGLSTSTKVVMGCFDHPAAARAMGIFSPGQLMLSCGTSWVGFFPEMERRKIIDAELLCDPFLSGNGGPWGAIFSVPYIGRAVDWYVDHVIAPGEQDRLAVFDESAAEAEPGAGGVRIDLREPPSRIEGKRSNVSRAVMEGAAMLLNEKIQQLMLRGMRFDKVVMVGGPSRSPVWPGIVEDITGLDLSIGSAHAGAQGAAILAGKGIGIFKNEQEAPL